MSDSVTRNEDGTWGFTCPEPSGCAPFTSTGWPTKTVAKARLDEHLHEHETGEHASELADFKAKHGVNL